MSKFISAGRTDVGKVRATNDDQFLVADLNKSMTVHSSTLPIEEETELYSGLKGQLLLVADGMSGMPGGQEAGLIGIGTIARYVLNTMPWFFSLNHDHDDDQEEELLAAMVETEQAVEAYVEANPELAGMGTTLTMAYLVWPRMYLVHIGDSRCYLLRGGELTQLTRDHNAAQGLIDDGTLSSENASRSPLSRVLLSSIGQGPSSFRPENYKVGLEPGDVVLLCTDGLTSQVSPAEIAALLAAAETPDVAATSLIDAASAAGGADNTTAVVTVCHPPIERPD